ncbi:helix-turn-helix domain-containing protein [Brevundimonas diminuta]|uniref:helix-turn-helix domain-containing protein n=1 Tax=Brevundimonas diminuta TaxID=293 RepID=UPI00320ABF25
MILIRKLSTHVFMGGGKTDTAMSSNTTHPTLGGIMRAIRAKNDWTLKEMSQHSGIPVSTLSKVEHDRLTLTYDKLLQLSQRLGMPMSELFSEGKAADPVAVTARRSLGSFDNAIRVETDNYVYHYLCPELRKKRMIPIVTHIRAKSVKDFGKLIRHAGEEYIYVLEGAIEVHTEFYDPVVLEKNQSIYLDSQMGHAFVVADGHEKASVLALCSSADEELFNEMMALRGNDLPASSGKAP